MTKKSENTAKIEQYHAAIEKYENKPLYIRTESFFSLLVISMQLLTTFMLLSHYQFSSVVSILMTLIFSYLLTDFINGFVHMIVDNSTNYSSFLGPFVAAFHTHHAKLKYKEPNPIKIYYYKSGHKIWLVVYLCMLCFIQLCYNLPSNVELAMVAFGIFSSAAEVSHYWCHKKENSKVVSFLQTRHVLLNVEHHRLHHAQDNINYAFLNGATDPLLNLIARYFF